MPQSVIVPEDKICETVNALITYDNATDIQIKKNPDGTWTVTGS